MKTLEKLIEVSGEKRVGVAREISKMHEQFVRGTAREVYEYFLKNKDKLKGEFVVIVEK